MTENKSNRKTKRTGKISIEEELILASTSEKRHPKFIPIPAEIRWKTVVSVMRTGEWMSIPYMQEQTGYSRKRMKGLMQKGMEAGIIEKRYEEGWQTPPRDTYHSKGQGWFYRRTAYYRLRLDKINIIIKDPSE